MIKVNIMLSTYNGEKFIEEQLNSLLNQRNVLTNIYIRDDGSKDNTVLILQEYQKKHKNIFLERGDNIGAKLSYYKLLEKTPLNADYYAFCDQDDVWHPDKLYQACNYNDMNRIFDTPIIYYSELTPVDSNMNPVKEKFRCGEAFTLEELLVKNNIYGCTLVFNQKLMQIYRKVDENYNLILPFHDHWIALICSIHAGIILYDSRSFIKYRQHKNNVVGTRRNMVDKLKKSGISDKRNTRYNRSVYLISLYGDEIPRREKGILKIVINYKLNALNRIKFAIRSHKWVRGILEKIALFILILLKKF